MVNGKQPEGTPLAGGSVMSPAEARGRPPAKETREFVRFTRHERTTHGIMIVSFIALALTGMTLKFSYTTWAAKVSVLLGGFQTCGYIHRTAAVAMFFNFASHLIGLVVLKNKKYPSWKSLIFGENSMIPGPNDGREFIATLKWFVGQGERPNYGRWTYWEKFDYFAVFWGIFVIGSTGLTLWFPVFFTRFLPGWMINVSTIVHSDEALLATGFIFTVHFFNTHLRPEKFPMDTCVFTGRMKISELKRDKPREYADLVASGELEENLAEPLPEIVVKAFRAFAWCALVVGTSIAVWIVYAMIFAYK